MDEELYLGGTYRFIGTVYESTGDTVPMDLSLDVTYAATLRLHRPDGTELVVTATIAAGSGGVVSYDTQKGDGTPGAGDLDQVGDWRGSWLITSATLYNPSQPFGFTVRDAMG